MSGASCPCGKGLYKDCCEPLHSGKTRAVHAEQLMRSRYSAFALQQIGYIVKLQHLVNSLIWKWLLYNSGVRQIAG